MRNGNIEVIGELLIDWGDDCDKITKILVDAGYLVAAVDGGTETMLKYLIAKNSEEEYRKGVQIVTRYE